MNKAFGVGIINDGHDEVNVLGQTFDRVKGNGNSSDNRKPCVSSSEYVEY